MVLAISQPVVENTSFSKVFEVTVPEGDAINIDTPFTYTTSGMTVLDSPPVVKIITNISKVNVPTNTCSIAAWTEAGTETTVIHLQKTSIAAGAAVQTFRVVILSREWYEV